MTSYPSVAYTETFSRLYSWLTIDIKHVKNMSSFGVPQNPAVADAAV